MISLMTLDGEQLKDHLPELARLRIRVFREFPYLYDGDLGYEQRYLQTYSESAGSVIILVRDDDRIVGASTALPLAHETDEVKAPFTKAGIDIDEIFYFGESVLLPEYRKRGLGSEFLDRREAHARQAGSFRRCCFCAVQRPADHPARPAGYQPLDAFWQKRGFRMCTDLTTWFSWKDLGEQQESPKTMMFWMKELV